jgi:hypothetical protein
MNKNANQNNQNLAARAKGGIGSFLLVILILSVIWTSFSVVAYIYGLASGSLSDSVASRNAFYWINIIMDPLIIVGSVAALALLWMRNKIGIVLKLSLLALSILVSLSTMGIDYKEFSCTDYEGQFISSVDDEGRTVISRSRSVAGFSTSTSFSATNSLDTCEELEDVFASLTNGPLRTIGVFVPIIFNIGVGLLWIFAWKDQQKRDGKSEFFS